MLQAHESGLQNNDPVIMRPLRGPGALMKFCQRFMFAVGFLNTSMGAGVARDIFPGDCGACWSKGSDLPCGHTPFPAANLLARLLTTERQLGAYSRGHSISLP